MRLVFTTEGGATYLTVTYSVREREVLDARCTALGMNSARTKTPCKMVGEESFFCWKTAERNIFLNSIFDRFGLSVHHSIVDSLNDPLFTDKTVNVALLRIQLPPNTPTKFKVSDAFMAPNLISSFEASLAEAMRSLYIAETNSQVEVTFTVGRSR